MFLGVYRWNELRRLVRIHCSRVNWKRIRYTPPSPLTKSRQYLKSLIDQCFLVSQHSYDKSIYNEDLFLLATIVSHFQNKYDPSFALYIPCAINFLFGVSFCTLYKASFDPARFGRSHTKPHRNGHWTRAAYIFALLCIRGCTVLYALPESDSSGFRLQDWVCVHIPEINSEQRKNHLTSKLNKKKECRGDVNEDNRPHTQG